MSDRQRANLESKFRGFAEEAIRADEAELLRLIRQVITSSGLVRVERLGGTLPPNAHNIVEEGSVVTSHEDYTAAIDLHTTLEEMLAAQAAPPVSVQEVDGDPLGAIRNFIFPNGSISIDDETDTVTVTFSAGTGDVVGPSASIDGEIALFDLTTGKLLKRATGTGVVKVTSGVFAATATINDLGSQTADYSANSHKLTNVTDPGSAQDAATKNYVDAIATGLFWKQAVRVATTAALPANTRSTNTLTATANGALSAIDGVTLVANDRLLVKDESTGANNGIYIVTTVGDGSHPFVLDRSSDANASSEVKAGMVCSVAEGSTNADKAFVLTTNDPITLNTTSLAFSQMSGGASLADHGHAATSDGGELTAPVFAESSTPSTPASNKAKIWVPDDNGWNLLSHIGSDAVVITPAKDGVVVVKNTTGSTIAKGCPVYLSGASSGVPLIAKARANASSTMPAIGLVLADIANNGFGLVLSHGQIAGFDTSGFSVGDTLYVSTATAGALQNTKPTSPNYFQAIARVLTSHATTGTVQVLVETMAQQVDIDLGFGIGDGINVITAGNAGWKKLSFPCTWVQWDLDADVSGSIALDVRRTTYSAWDGFSTHPASGDSISSGGTQPALVTATKNTDSTLSGYTVALVAGDIIQIQVTGTPASVKHVEFNMVLRRVI